MSYNLLAFFIGFFGSIHCTLMCGPLLFAINPYQKFNLLIVLNKVVYQIGRILTYGIIGGCVGFLSNAIFLKNWQQVFSITTGFLLIIIGIMHSSFLKSNYIKNIQTTIMTPFAKCMSKWLNKPYGSFIAGIMNGMLPCGMVYMALASAMNAENVFSSIQFMLCFGLGTIPLMLLFSILAGQSKSFLKIKFTKVLPILYCIIGLWFILRGANLNIPYLSPLLYIDGAISCQ